MRKKVGAKRKKTGGRQREYPLRLRQDGKPAKDDGAPRLTLRLEPALLEEVKRLGGAEWVRKLIKDTLNWK